MSIEIKKKKAVTYVLFLKDIFESYFKNKNMYCNNNY